MNRAALLALVFLFPAHSRAAGPACQPPSVAREKFFAGEVQASVAIFRCLLKANPNDTDTLRVLSDLEWREGHASASVKYARRAYPLVSGGPDFDSALVLWRRISRVRLSADFATMRASAASGESVRAEAGFRYYEKNSLALAYSRLSRVFYQSSRLSNSVIALSHTLVPARRTYVETPFSYSPNPAFSPKWTAGIDPHLVFADASDATIGYQYSRFITQSTSDVHAGWSRPLSDLFTLGLRASLLFEDETLGSGSAFGDFTFSPRWGLRLSAAGGSALESQKLRDRFYSVDFRLKYSFTPGLSARLTGGTYRGDIRKENSLGAGLDVYL